MTSVHEEAKTRVIVDSELSEEFEVEMGMQQRFGSSLGVLSELMYADYLVVMSETIDGLGNKFRKRDETFMSIGLKPTFGKPQSDGQWRHYKGWLA